MVTLVNFREDQKDEFIIRLRNIRVQRGSVSHERKVSSMLNNRLKNITASRGVKGGAGSAKGYGYIISKKSFFQRSVVKISYVENKDAGQWAAHGKYLEREGTQKDKSKAIGYSDQNKDVSMSDTLEGWQKAGDERIFKFIVSPEMGHKLDLKEHVQKLMIEIQNDLGGKLEWVAVNHYNTDQPHSHIIIRGIDWVGQPLRFSRNYISQGIRSRSMEVATRQLGMRLKSDILESRERLMQQKRFTELDREILKLKDRNVVNLNIGVGNDYMKQRRLHIIGRLQYLEKHGFVRKVGNLKWEINTDLKNALKLYQQSQDLIKRKNLHLGNITEKNLPLVMTKLQKGQSLVGRIVGFGLLDEISDRRYILVEGVDGKVHYMRPSGKLVKGRNAGNIRNGDIVYLEGRNFNLKGRSIDYLYVNIGKSMNSIKNMKEITDFDRYILEIADKTRQINKYNKEPKVFRKIFQNLAYSRLRYMRELGIIDMKPELNIRKIPSLPTNLSEGEILSGTIISFGLENKFCERKISDQTFDIVNENDRKNFVKDLRINGYINQDNVIQEKFRKLDNAVEMKLNKQYDCEIVEQVFNEMKIKADRHLVLIQDQDGQNHVMFKTKRLKDMRLNHNVAVGDQIQFTKDSFVDKKSGKKILYSRIEVESKMVKQKVKRGRYLGLRKGVDDDGIN